MMAGFSTYTKLSQYGEGMMIYKDGKELFLDKIECGMLSASIKRARETSWDKYRLPRMVEQKHQSDEAKMAVKCIGGVIGVRQAKCGICGEAVEHAFYDEQNHLCAEDRFVISNRGQLLLDRSTLICGAENTAYHFEPNRDCWGKKTGCPNFGKMETKKEEKKKEVKRFKWRFWEKKENGE